MRGLVLSTLLVAIGVVAGGCGSSGSPATTPAVTSTVSVTTTTIAPTTSSSTTSSSTTTTASTTVVPSTSTTLDRVGEIEALFQDLEDRRLRALYEGDREAFRALFANDEYRDKSMGAFDLVEFFDGWEPPRVEITAVEHDDDRCIEAVMEADYTDVVIHGALEERLQVVEFVDGRWGISFAGEGWACDGPHPFSP